MQKNIALIYQKQKDKKFSLSSDLKVRAYFCLKGFFSKLIIGEAYYQKEFRLLKMVGLSLFGRYFGSEKFKVLVKLLQCKII